MREIFELKISDPKNIYREIAQVLVEHREKETCSVEFIVEGTKEKPIVGIRYPGRKVKKRNLKRKRQGTAEWANLYDFVVVPYIEGSEAPPEDFTFEKLLIDFYINKKDSAEFWSCIEEVYYENKLSKNPPELPGIEPKLFLLVLKWIWIQEDFNYKLEPKDVDSKINYVLETKTGTRTSRGAGRAKFFAALILLKHHFTLEEVKKIIPLY
jgi:hypothetical protein